MVERHDWREARHGSTGVEGFDRIGFSGAPRARKLTGDDLPFTAVRLAGVEGQGTASAASAGASDLWDAVMVNRGVNGIAGDAALRQAPPAARPKRHGGVGAADAQMEFPADASSCIQCYFPREYLARRAGLAGPRDLRPIMAEPDPTVMRLSLMIEQELLAPGFGSRLLLDGLLGALAVSLVRGHARGHDDANRIRLGAAQLNRVVGFMEEHIDANVGVAQLAGVAGLSTFHFARMFKHATGRSPYQFLRERRLARARTLLATSDLSLAEMALACGFANQAHFTAAFTRMVGMPPGRCRRHVRA